MPAVLSVLALSTAHTAHAQQTSVYVYDVHGRLTSAAGNVSSNATYQYDAADNRILRACCEMIGPTIQADGFDGAYYRVAYPDIRNAELDPYSHWLNYGYAEPRNPNRFFDAVWYRATYGVPTTTNALTDYHTTGWKLGRNPSPEFSTDLYLDAYPDVRAANVDPLWHYLVAGYGEGRSRFPVP